MRTDLDVGAGSAAINLDCADRVGVDVVYGVLRRAVTEVPADVVPPVLQEFLVRPEELHRGVPLREIALIPPLLRSLERVIAVQDDERAVQLHELPTLLRTK